MVQKPVVVYFPVEVVEKVDQLVEAGLYPSRNEAIRTAVQDMLRVETVWKVLVSDRVLREILRRRGRPALILGEK